ncbi:Histone acetyltransferase type B catalytic subunit [Smittium culicis]|uniref:Histone acetyltransferase type B catalytic subunit n=1 Tax=Smittium culicis TaxID=133412 RepID=A0A1R1YTZ6_9FUNG|nr:Histone acetyltransferase type B catalytic subunit [Smittium culicis]
MNSLDPEVAAKWVTNSNDATIIRLFSGEDTMTIEKYLDKKHDKKELGKLESDVDIVEFNPDFTYTIYGDLERIFGYKNLEISVNISSGSLKTYLQIDYDSKIDDLEHTSNVVIKSDEVEAPIKNFLSDDLIPSRLEFAAQVSDDTINFRPIGKKVFEYTLENESHSKYIIYESDFTDSNFVSFHKRLQAFVMFYIEGGQYIDDTDKKWTVYTFQFLILPPFQQFGHGSNLYNYIREAAAANPQVYDLTVEDPNESFDDMRDKNDLRFLIKSGNINLLKEIKPLRSLKEEMGKLKFSTKQLTRIFELGHLYHLKSKSTESEDMRNYRVCVKKRIFKQNYDILISLSDAERKDKLKDTFNNVYQDYLRILSLV